jgi:surfeit locus 1 family protein
MLSRKLVIAAAAGVFGIWATCSLGFWQLRRAAGKELLQQQIDAAASALPSSPDARSLQQPESLIHRHLRFEGRWVTDHVVYLDNRPQSGQAGFYVLMGLKIERPAAAEVIVDRGWIARDASDRTRIAPYRTPDGIVDVTGVALEDEPRLLELAKPSAWPLKGIWQNFDFDAFARASGQSPVRVIVRQDRSADADGSDGLSRDWPDRGGALQSQIDRHHGYAFQWFALAATLAALLIYRLVRAFQHGRPVPSR